MHPELETLTKWVWNNRTRIMKQAPVVSGALKSHMVNQDYNPAVQLIYDEYNKTESDTRIKNKSKDQMDHRVEKYRRSLLSLKQQLPGSMLDIQGNSFTSAKNARESDVIILQYDDIAGTFFHFKKRRGNPTHRIYMNVNEYARLKLFSGVARRVWNINGLINCKLIGPGSLRADTIVIYVDGVKGKNDVVDAIKDYAKHYEKYFGMEVPKLTKRVRGLRGVSLGMEPPLKQLIEIKGDGGKKVYAERNVNQSFGTYRAHLMFMALEKASEHKRYRFFPSSHYRDYQKQVIRCFMAANIDVNRPWRHKDMSSKVPVEFKSSAPLEQQLKIVDRQYAKMYG